MKMTIKGMGLQKIKSHIISYFCNLSEFLKQHGISFSLRHLFGPLYLSWGTWHHIRQYQALHHNWARASKEKTA